MRVSLSIVCHNLSRQIFQGQLSYSGMIRQKKSQLLLENDMKMNLTEENAYLIWVSSLR